MGPVTVPNNSPLGNPKQGKDQLLVRNKMTTQAGAITLPRRPFIQTQNPRSGYSLLDVHHSRFPLVCLCMVNMQKERNKNTAENKMLVLHGSMRISFQSDRGQRSSSLPPSRLSPIPPPVSPFPRDEHVSSSVESTRRVPRHPNLAQPLSVLTAHMVDVPIRDMDKWVRRTTEERKRDELKSQEPTAHESFLLVSICIQGADQKAFG